MPHLQTFLGTGNTANISNNKGLGLIEYPEPVNRCSIGNLRTIQANEKSGFTNVNFFLINPASVKFSLVGT